jgi:DNA replication protein DnaC
MSELREKIAQCCKRLRLRRMTDNLDRVSEADPEAFLLRLLELEVQHRDRGRVERAIKNAGFYTPKSLEDFLFHEVTLPAQLTEQQLLGLEFIVNRQNLILYGNVGTGNYVKQSLMQSCRRRFLAAKDEFVRQLYIIFQRHNSESQATRPLSFSHSGTIFCDGTS